VFNNFTSDDILVVSLGGNDIALKPNGKTIRNILAVLVCSYFSNSDNPFGVGHFIDLFGKQV